MKTRFILSDYLAAAEELAEYEKLKDGSYCGRIAACKGVVAFAATLMECQRELRSTLEEWLLLGLRLGHPLPIIKRINLNRAEPIHEPLESV